MQNIVFFIGFFFKFSLPFFIHPLETDWNKYTSYSNTLCISIYLDLAKGLYKRDHVLQKRPRISRYEISLHLIPIHYVYLHVFGHIHNEIQNTHNQIQNLPTSSESLIFNHTYVCVVNTFTTHVIPNEIRTHRITTHYVYLLILGYTNNQIQNLPTQRHSYQAIYI